ncbi:MAG: [Fe-Fe] hydrogenase large subunit C-terminal domain-containing protein [archaeon]|nr:[Fe-Fe] hydrogenase large subunit C-terminal domain-containing protein [archaeon]
MEKEVCELIKSLKQKDKFVIMLAPSFVVDFSYPSIICELKKAGFDKVVELTFGAKMINREYHDQLKTSKKLIISSVCPGVVEFISRKYPKYRSNLISVDSPMSAMAKICKKTYPNHKIVFVSPCNFKKVEAKTKENKKNIDFVINYIELKQVIFKCVNKKEKTCKLNVKNARFDKFYNDYTKIYPVSGGLSRTLGINSMTCLGFLNTPKFGLSAYELKKGVRTNTNFAVSKTADLNHIILKKETKIIDGIKEVEKFLKTPDKTIRFLDVTFCKGGCIGGPCINSKLSIDKRKKKVLNYLKIAKKEDIPNSDLGVIQKARNISFLRNK